MALTERKVCLDLFSGLGGFSQSFADSDQWDVVTVDIEDRFDPDLCADVMDLRPSDFEADFDIVLAGHPCTEFSVAQNMNGDHEPDPDHVAMVYHTLGLIKALRPSYWFLENPRGRLRSYIGRPTATVTYCQYGENHMKPTDLWGVHPPMTYRRCNYGDDCHENTRDGCNEMRHGQGKKTPSERSKVPYQLSKAIRDGVDAAFAGDVAEQSTLPV